MYLVYQLNGFIRSAHNHMAADDYNTINSSDDLRIAFFDMITDPMQVKHSYVDIETGQLEQIGGAPNDYSVFDYGSKKWVEDAALKDQFDLQQVEKNKQSLIDDGYDYNGVKIKIDAESRLNIAGKALYLQLNPNVDTVHWRADGRIVSMTAAEFTSLASAISDYYESIILS